MILGQTPARSMFSECLPDLVSGSMMGLASRVPKLHHTTVCPDDCVYNISIECLFQRKASLSKQSLTTMFSVLLPDSLLVKITAKARNRKDAAAKLTRALREFRVRGVQTNKSFLLNVLSNSDFLDGEVDTGFIAANPTLLSPLKEKDRAQKLLHYIGEVVLNGTPKSLGATGEAPSPVDPMIPEIVQEHKDKKHSLKQIFDMHGPEAFAKAVRANEGLLITDTTWRDAHQSLLATRLRTIDMLKIAEPTRVALRNAYSLECWGGATFDVSMRFLHECPWDRLSDLREAVPDVPFQMLLRGANAVGYTSYADNVVYEFCKLAKESGMDVFRVFDSLNYIENMKLGIDAVGQAGGIVEAAVCYTGDVSNPDRGLYDLEYYLQFVRELEKQGIHVLAIKGEKHAAQTLESYPPQVS
jgi:pyruvate carboxylase